MSIVYLLEDLAQRIITLDKRQARGILAEKLKEHNLQSGCKALDFGCGAGLLSRVFIEYGIDYYGYDIDAKMLEYARWLYPKCTFVNTIKEALAQAPYDVILANICFHHIPNNELMLSVLPAINSMMSSKSVFVLIDALPLENNASFIRRAYNKLERGHCKRCEADIQEILEREFLIKSKCIKRSYILALDTKFNPVYNDLFIYDLVTK